MANKIFDGNYKGGVGKTTTAFQIAMNMVQKHDKKVLLLDLDPQGSLSRICTKMSNAGLLPNIKVEKTLNYLLEIYSQYYRRFSKLDILIDEKKTDESILRLLKTAILSFINKFEGNKTGFLAYIPTRLDLTNARINDIAQQLSKYSMGVVGISKLLEDIENNCAEEFDYIIIDCPPTINCVIESVFLKSDYYIIPTIADDISIEGVIDYLKVIEKTFQKYTFDSLFGGVMVEKMFGKKPNFLGILETFASNKRDTAQSEYMKSLNRYLIENHIEFFGNSKKYFREYDSTNYIFENRIDYLTNSTSGVHKMTSLGFLHDAYEKITNDIIDIIEN